jgi:hypothetical protein
VYKQGKRVDLRAQWKDIMQTGNSFIISKVSYAYKQYRLIALDGLRIWTLYLLPFYLNPASDMFVSVLINKV